MDVDCRIIQEEPEIIRKLRLKGRERGCTLSLLHLLAGSDKQIAVEGAKYLLDNKSYLVDIRESEGITPLHVASNWDNLAMCQLLLSYGADPYLKDDEGRSALDLASGKCLEFLQKYDKLPKVKRRNLIQRFMYVIKPKSSKQPKRSVVQRCVPRRLCRSLGGCLIGLGQPRESKEIEASPSSGCPSTKTAPIEVKVEDLKIVSPVSSQESNFFDALDESQVTKRKKQSHDVQVIPAVTDCSKSNEPAVLHDKSAVSVPSSELPLETTMEYLTCDEEEEQTVVVPECIRSLTDRHLKMHLEALKQKVGPITTETRLLYRRRLALLMKDESTKSVVQYSAPMKRLLEGRPPSVGRVLDKSVRGAFRSDIASPHQRQGNSAAFFCYILIDPKLVPSPAAECSFKDFVGAIFYVGKGKKSRPVQHLVDAAKSRSSTIPRSDKLKRILGLWDSGRGVVSLQIFQNVISVESHCREAAMLDAIGIRNLTNLKRGEYYDICIHWNSRQREEFGAFLLHSAWQIFRIEGSREIFEKDVI